MAKSKENKKLLQQGSKNRAGRLLSGYLRAIAQEVTELVDVVISPDKVERRLVSKGEAMARDIFDKALKKDGEIDAKLQATYRGMLFDRIEGKAGDNDRSIKRDVSVPDRISDINRERLNAAAKEIAEAEEEGG